MSPAVSRCRAWCARAAIVLSACPAVARGQDVPATPAPVVPPAPGATGAVLDPTSPLSDMPGIGVDWPDLAKPDAPIAAPPVITSPVVGPPAPATPAAPAKSAKKEIDAAGEQRYVVTLAGIDDIKAPDLTSRFDSLSSLKQGESKAANVAQIDRRAREDAGLLSELLRAYGYYDAEVDARVGGAAGITASGQPRLSVTLTAAPGPLYTFTGVSLPGVANIGADKAAIVHAFGVQPGDAVNADKVTAGLAAVKVALGERGYPFATVSDPQIAIDHDSHEAILVLPVDPGQSMRFGAFRVSGTKHVFGARHVALISRIHPGDRYNVARIDDLRRALIQTGLVSIAQVAPVRTSDPHVFDLDVHLEPAPPRTVSASLGYVTGPRTTTGTLGYLTTTTAGSLGYGTGQGITTEIDWTHRNLFPPEGGLTLRGVLGSQEQLASAIFRRNNFRSRDQILTAELTIDHLNVPAYEARSIDLTTGIERQTNIIWQKKWTYSYGLEFLGSDESDVIQATGQPRRRTYVVAALPLSLSYDGSDDLLNPTRGWRIAVHVSPEESLHNATFTYVRIQLDGSAYQPIGKRVVLAGRVRFGTIQGGSTDEIAPSRRFYSGGGGSVRGFGYQDIGPRDIDNNPVGGASLVEFGAEARIRFGNFGIVPFLDGGNLYTASVPSFGGMRYGTGLGVRYYTSFGPIRLDVGTPINRRQGDSRLNVYVSLGQAF
jgi:translocation and assembly module TamA